MIVPECQIDIPLLLFSEITNSFHLQEDSLKKLAELILGANFGEQTTVSNKGSPGDQ